MVDTDGMELRLAQFIQYKTGGKKSAFAEKLGWSKQYLNNMLSGASIGFAPLVTLLKTFPELNARWLLFGEGNMLEGSLNVIKRQLLQLLRLDEYIAVMTPEEVSAVQAGQYDWSEEQFARWEVLSLQRKQNINAHFTKSQEGQK